MTQDYKKVKDDEELLEICEEDANKLGVEDGEMVKVSSRRGEVPSIKVRITDKSSPGLAFTTFHFPETAAINKLTINAVDPRSGTAEFKACAIKIEKS
nr:formate dehydrogenase H subunit alpha, selenocysteine-containing [Rubrobacter sp.]